MKRKYGNMIKKHTYLSDKCIRYIQSLKEEAKRFDINATYLGKKILNLSSVL